MSASDETPNDKPDRKKSSRDSDRRPPRDGRAPARRDGDARPRRDGDARPQRSGDARPRRDGDQRPRRDGDERPKWSSDSRPRRDGDARPRRDGDARPPRSGDARPRRDGDARPPRSFDKDRAPRDDRFESDSGPRHDDPHIPDAVVPADLDRLARNQLKTLSKENAEWVAKHLVMAARLIEEDPPLAHRHALAAARRAGRIAVVRETLAITAYATEDFALALRELRTYRRISGNNDQLPLMVDSERGVGRPEKALELGRSIPKSELDVEVQVALAIAMSGARLDLGQPELALTELQIPQLDPERAFAWSPALFDAYATVLEDLGHTEEAEQWWQRSDRATIALENAAIPEGEVTVEVIEELLEEEPAASVEAPVAEAESNDSEPEAPVAEAGADVAEPEVAVASAEENTVNE